KPPEDVDIIHYPYFDPFFLTLPLKKRVKTIVTVHDLTPLVFPDAFPAGIKGKLSWQVQKYSLKSASAIIADSEASKKDIIRLTGIDSNKIHVVYLAAGEEFERLQLSDTRNKELRKKYKLPENFLLYVGDVTWNKNLPRLLDAIEEANVPLVMI